MVEDACSEAGCTKPVRARGWCSTHYNRWQRDHHEPDECSVDRCSKPAHGRGLCNKHHHRALRHGDPEFVVRPKKSSLGETPTEYQRRWRRENAERWKELRRRSNRSYRARKRGVESEPYSTTEIADRDGWRCGICRKAIGETLSYPHPRSLSIDHIVPLVSGGRDVPANVQAAHLVCNVRKGARGAGQLRLEI